MANFEAMALKHLISGNLSMLPELHPDLFTKQYSKLYLLCLDFFDSNKKLPGLSELQAVVEAKAPTAVRPQYLATVELIKNLDVTHIDSEIVLNELRDQKVLREVDTQISELVEAQRDKDAGKVKVILNKLTEKVNLKGIKITDLADAKDSEETHNIVRSFLEPEFEDVLGGGHTGLTVYSAKSGGGKALMDDTLIPTTKGKVRIADLQIGDFVYGRQGQPTKVIGVFPQGVRPTYRVTLIDGRSILADAEHIWTVIDHNGKELDKTTSDLLADGLCKMWYDKRYNSYQRSHKYYLPLCSPVQYSAKSYTIPPYVFGAILGDGGTSTGWITYTSGDPELINFIKHDVGDDAVVTSRQREYSYGITKCPTYLEYIQDNNLIVKSSGKYIPEEYLQGSVDQRELLLQGLLDTDGYVSSTNSRIEFTTVSERLALGVAELVRSLGGVCTTAKKLKSGYRNRDGIYVECQPVYRLNIRFYVDSPIRPFRLSRKAHKYKNSNKRKSIAITSIDYISDMKCTCIKVDAEDHLFIAGDYIVTHNTIALLQTAINNYRAGKNVLFVSLELPRAVLYKRLLSNITGIDFKLINTNLLTPEEREACTKAHEEFFSSNNQNWFKIVDDSISDSELLNLIAVQSQLNNVEVVCVDYLQLVELDGFGDDWRALSSLCKKLHRLTRKYNVCVITAAQINTEGKEKGKLMPKITARGSKEIEFSSSQFIHFDVEPDMGAVIMFQKKNRISAPKHMVLDVEFKYMRIHGTDVILEE